MPYKSWSPGEVLSASDVNTYLMEQMIMNFSAGTASASTALRDVLVAGMVIYGGGGKLYVWTGTTWKQVAE